jgi:putative transposase
MIAPSHQLSIRQQCVLLGLHRSGLYYCPQESFEEMQVMNLISEVHRDYPYYGYRKVHWHLKEADGLIINRKRVYRLMKAMGIEALVPKPRTTLPDRDNKVFPYLLAGLEINRPNQVWAVDITYIKLPVGMVYLFALIDWYSRFVVGYKLGNTMEAIHGIEVMEAALSQGIPPEICNADQGSQFTGTLWVNTLNMHGIKVSHDGVGRCIDNVRIERFWRSVKYEDVFLHAYETLGGAKQGIGTYINHYNYNRPHQALGYRTPSQLYFGRLGKRAA